MSERAAHALNLFIEMNEAQVWLRNIEGFPANELQDLPLDDLFELYRLSVEARREQ